MKTLNHGFTLVELLVVIAIIGVLSTVVISNVNSARLKGRDTQRKIEVDQMIKALNLYYSDIGYLPGNTANQCVTTSDATFGPTFATALQPYLSTIPHDPTIVGSTGDFLFHNIVNNLGQYEICAQLEQSTSGNGSFDRTSCTGGVTYNYCVVQS